MSSSEDQNLLDQLARALSGTTTKKKKEKEEVPVAKTRVLHSTATEQILRELSRPKISRTGRISPIEPDFTGILNRRTGQPAQPEDFLDPTAVHSTDILERIDSAVYRAAASTFTPEELDEEHKSRQEALSRMERQRQAYASQMGDSIYWHPRVLERFFGTQRPVENPATRPLTPSNLSLQKTLEGTPILTDKKDLEQEQQIWLRSNPNGTEREWNEHVQNAFWSKPRSNERSKLTVLPMFDAIKKVAPILPGVFVRLLRSQHSDAFPFITSELKEGRSLLTDDMGMVKNAAPEPGVQFEPLSESTMREHEETCSAQPVPSRSALLDHYRTCVTTPKLTESAIEDHSHSPIRFIESKDIVKGEDGEPLRDKDGNPLTRGRVGLGLCACGDDDCVFTRFFKKGGSVVGDRVLGDPEALKYLETQTTSKGEPIFKQELENPDSYSGTPQDGLPEPALYTGPGLQGSLSGGCREGCVFHTFLQKGGQVNVQRTNTHPFKKFFSLSGSEEALESLKSAKTSDGQSAVEQRTVEPYSEQCANNPKCPIGSHIRSECTLEEGHKPGCELTGLDKDGKPRLQKRNIAGRLLSGITGPIRAWVGSQDSVVDTRTVDTQKMDPDRLDVMSLSEVIDQLGGREKLERHLAGPGRATMSGIRQSIASGQSLLPDLSRAQEIYNIFRPVTMQKEGPQIDINQLLGGLLSTDKEKKGDIVEPTEVGPKLPPATSSRVIYRESSTADEEFDRLMNFRVFNASTHLACYNCGCEVERSGFCKQCATEEQRTQSIIDSVGDRDVAKDMWGITDKPDIQQSQVEAVNPGSGIEPPKPVR